jgi:hypothetical protein
VEPSIKIGSLILSAFFFCFVSCRKEETKNEDTISVRVPPANNPPVANAGADETIILPVNTALLFGDKSYDPDRGDKIASYKWSKIFGPDNCILENETEAVSIAKSLVKGMYLFELIVADSNGLTSKDTVVVRVEDAARESTLIFENLTWVNDFSQKFVYMRTPPIPAGYSLDSVLSVSISIVDFDYVGFVWRTVPKGGSDVGVYYYKIQGNTIMVYKYYETYIQYINLFVQNKIRVIFK